MIEKRRFDGKRVAIFTVLFAVIAVSLITLAGYVVPAGNASSSSTAQNQFNGVTPLETIYNITSPVTIQQAASLANYSLVLPSSLPSGVSFAMSRYNSIAGAVYLVYSVDGSTLISSSSTKGLLIVEQYASTNPLPPRVSVYPAVIATAVTTISSTTSTVGTYTLEQATTYTSAWSSATIAGQSVLTITAGGLSQIQWWHNNVWIQIVGSMPLSSLEGIAQSMLTSPPAVGS